MKKFIFALFLPLSLIIFLSGYAFAIPSEAPPAGKVWVEVDGSWILVVAPPGDGPYIWKNGKWVLDSTPPTFKLRVGTGHWLPGHWK